MSRPWLQDDFKHSSKSRSKSPTSGRKRVKVDQFGRSLPSRSRSKSRSRSGSRGRSRREGDVRQSHDTSRPRRDEPRSYSREGREGRSRDRGRREKPRRREGSSSSSESGSGSRSPHTRLVASTKPKYLNARLFVANIVSKEVTKDELIKQFEKYGNVVDVLVHPKNYAFIQYLKEEHAKLAVEGEHGSTMRGWRLDVKMANENRKGAGGGRGGRGGERGGRGGGRGHYGSMDRDRSPLRDDPYADPYRPGRGPPGYPPPPGGARPFRVPPTADDKLADVRDYGIRDPYYPDPYRRGYPDPWLPPDDPYRRDPYADPYRDPYAMRPPPPPIECEIFLTNSQIRAYGDAVERRVKEHNIITAVSILPEGRTAPQMVEELTAANALFAIFINPQNETHRSLTLNILHGTPQEHRNMPLDDAIALVGRSFLKYVEGLREKANAAAAPASTSSTTRVFLPASAEVAYLLNLLADNRALTVAELNTVIKYLQERRDKLLDAESRPIITDDGLVKPPPIQRSDGDQAIAINKDMTQTQQELTSKILSIFTSAGGSIQGVPPANGTQEQKRPSGTPAPAPPPPAPVASSASLINFDNPNVQKALDNLIQSSPSLLKNINTKTSMSAAQMGIPSVSTSMGTMGSSQGYGQSAGMMQSSQSQGQLQNSQGQMQGRPPVPGQGGNQGGYGGIPGGPGGMQGQRMPGMAQGGMQGAQGGMQSAQGGYNMQGQQMGRGYGPPPPRY